MAFVHSPAALKLAKGPASARAAPAACSAFHGVALAAAARPRAQRAAVRAPVTCNDGTITFDALDGAPYRVGVVWTRWNVEMVKPMVDDVKGALSDLGVKQDNVVEMQVPGAFELPMAARLMCLSQKVDAVVAVGVLIKGETDHYDYIASAVAHGLMDIQLSLNVPCVFGVLTCHTKAAAEARSTGDKSHAADWGKTAVEMAVLRGSQVGTPATGGKRVGF